MSIKSYSRNSLKKYNITGKIQRCIRSLYLCILICAMTSYIVSYIVEKNGDDAYSSLLMDLNRGDYAGCAEYYRILLNLGEINQKKYAQFDEFERFYSEYIVYVEYSKAKEPEKYRLQSEECMADMEGICANSIYNDNIPHYKYLLESLKANE